MASSRRRQLALLAGALTVATLICALTIVIQPIQCNSITSQQAPPSAAPTEAKSAGADTKQAAPAQPSKPVAAAAAAAAAAEPERKGRASDEQSASKVPAAPTEVKEASTSEAKPKEEKLAPSKPVNEPKAAPAAKGQPARQQPTSPKSSSSSSTKSKLPANLGTVTSTGSGGPAHYMSKHDAYSAIAEKHGALAQDAMRHTQKVGADRRAHLQRFGGIQKASGGGVGDMLNPFRGVTDSGLARSEYGKREFLSFLS